MSSYTDHPFFTDWESFKTEVDNFDSKVLTSDVLKEFLRFKKVVNFVDNLLENTDPELLSKSNLDNAKTNLSSTLASFNSFKSNGTITYIQQANAHIDNVLAIVKPYVFYANKLKNSLRSAIKTYIDEVNKHLENIPDTEEEYTKAKEFREKIEEYYGDLFESTEEEESIKDQIDELLQKIETEYDEISKLYNELLIDDEEESTKTAIEEAKKEILSDVEEAREKLTEASSKIDELDKFYVKVFGSINDETGQREGGLKQEIEARFKELEAYKEEQEKLFNELMTSKQKELDDYDQKQRERHKQLYQHIESLLPGATSAGLAKAYQERKGSYKWPIIIWNGVFIVALAGMFFGGYKSLENLTSWEEMLRHLLKFSPLYVPAIWLAIYASKRRSESRALEEEYAHKEAMAKSYSSYKKQIEELEQQNQELMERLMNKTIDTIAENPSKVLDKKHGDNHPLVDIAEKAVTTVVKK